MTTANVGAVCFGIVVGWITYRTLVRRQDAVALSDLATVIGAIGGGAVVSLYKDENLFGLYAIGLAVGFFGYLIVFARLNGTKAAGTVMGDGQGSVKIPQ